jgi:hypothetical protein
VASSQESSASASRRPLSRMVQQAELPRAGQVPPQWELAPPRQRRLRQGRSGSQTRHVAALVRPRRPAMPHRHVVPRSIRPVLLAPCMPANSRKTATIRRRSRSMTLRARTSRVDVHNEMIGSPQEGGLPLDQLQTFFRRQTITSNPPSSRLRPETVPPKPSILRFTIHKPSPACGSDVPERPRSCGIGRCDT